MSDISTFTLDKFLMALNHNDLATIKRCLNDYYFTEQYLEGETGFMHKVVGNSNFEIVELLYNSLKNKEPLLNSCLIVGTQKQDVQLVKFSIDNGVDVCCFGNKALYEVVAENNGNLEIAQLLVDHKAYIDGSHKEGQKFNLGENSPFYHAVLHGHFDIVKMLVDKTQHISFREYNILTTIEKNNPKTNEILKYLFEYDRSHNKFSAVRIFDKFVSLSLRFFPKAKFPHYVLAEYDQLLKDSAKYNNFEMVEFLIHKGINKNIVYLYGNEESKAFVSRCELNNKLDKSLDKHNFDGNTSIKRKKI